MTIGELSLAWLAAWSADRPGRAFAELCAVDVHYEDPLSGGPRRGAPALADHAARLRGALPDARLEPAGGRPHGGGFVALPCRVVGTHTGAVGDLPPTGRRLSLHALFYCELEGAAEELRMRRVRCFIDLLDAGRQLGLLPGPGTAAERMLMALAGWGLRG